MSILEYIKIRREHKIDLMKRQENLLKEAWGRLEVRTPPACAVRFFFLFFFFF